MECKLSTILALMMMPSMLIAPVHAITMTAPRVEDTQPGWIWNGMNESDDDGFSAGTSHAGGPGSTGDYTFTGTGVRIYGLKGTDIVVDGHHHKLGRMRVSIDGHEKADISVTSDTPDYSAEIYDVEGLSSGLHVLEVEPVGGWAAVDYIEVGTADGDSSASGAGQLSTDGKYVFFDGLDNMDKMLSRSNGWQGDSTNAQYLGNDPARIVRSADTKEYIAYRGKNVTSFAFRLYTRMPYQSLRHFVHIYASTDLGTTVQLAEYWSANTFDGGNSGGWTGYDLMNKSTLPEGTNAIFMTVDPGTGANYDPEISQVQIVGAK